MNDQLIFIQVQQENNKTCAIFMRKRNYKERTLTEEQYERLTIRLNDLQGDGKCKIEGLLAGPGYWVEFLV